MLNLYEMEMKSACDNGKGDAKKIVESLAADVAVLLKKGEEWETPKLSIYRRNYRGTFNGAN